MRTVCEFADANSPLFEEPLSGFEQPRSRLLSGVESSRKGCWLVGYVIHLICRPHLRAQLGLGCPPFHIGRQGEPRP